MGVGGRLEAERAGSSPYGRITRGRLVWRGWRCGWVKMVRGPSSRGEVGKAGLSEISDKGCQTALRRRRFQPARAIKRTTLGRVRAVGGCECRVCPGQGVGVGLREPRTSGIASCFGSLSQCNNGLHLEMRYAPPFLSDRGSWRRKVGRVEVSSREWQCRVPRGI